MTTQQQSDRVEADRIAAERRATAERQRAEAFGRLALAAMLRGAAKRKDALAKARIVAG